MRFRYASPILLSQHRISRNVICNCLEEGPEVPYVLYFNHSFWNNICCAGALIIPAGIEETLLQWKCRKPKGTKYFFTTIKGGQLSNRYLCDMIKRYGRKAKIDKIISPHTLRHTFATEFYRQTKDIETLRRILGHSDISTTTIYITLANIDVENGMKSFKGFI